jgi:hypothetical protein
LSGTTKGPLLHGIRAPSLRGYVCLTLSFPLLYVYYIL